MPAANGGTHGYPTNAARRRSPKVRNTRRPAAFRVSLISRLGSHPMTKMSALTGVAHDIAHHSASGLSYLSPHLAEALRAAGERTTEIELLDPEPYPANAKELQPLRLALLSLKTTVEAILRKHGFSTADVASVVLQATPVPWDTKGYILHTRSIITGKNGRAYDSGWLQ